MVFAKEDKAFVINLYLTKDYRLQRQSCSRKGYEKGPDLTNSLRSCIKAYN